METSANPDGHVKIKCHSSYEATVTERTFRKWSDCHRKLPAYINVYTTSFEFCDVRKCDPNDRTNERTNDKQTSNALAKIHKSCEDLARVKNVNVVKNRWLPSLRSAAINNARVSVLPWLTWREQHGPAFNVGVIRNTSCWKMFGK
jgi:hypothetical protein